MLGRASWLSIALACVLVLQGCVGGLDLDGSSVDGLGDDGAPPSPAEVVSYASTRLVQDHEHPVAHDAHVGTIGLDPLGFAPARDGDYPDGEVYMELAVKGEHAFVTFGPREGFLNPGDEAGFIVYDVSDPSQPEEIGRWLGQPLGDIEISNDGDYVFASTQRNGYPYPYTINPEAGPDGHAPRGTYIVDVTDETEPETVGFQPLPSNGPHTITYVEHPDGRELLLQSTYDILFTTYPENVGQNPATQKVVISEFDRSIEQLQPLSTFQKIVEPEQEATRFPHDATAHVDPGTDRLIMDVAYWDLGLITVDITNPANPTELGSFTDTGPSAYTQTHLVRVFPGTIENRTVAVLEPEIPSGEDDGQFTFVDLSDPADPVKLGYWSLPGEQVIDRPFIFSPHNFDLACASDGQPVSPASAYAQPCEDPTVVASHFHGGLWTLDASDPTDPRPTGFFFPSVDRANVGQGFPFTGFASAFIVNGTVYAPEIWTGLHTLAVTPG